MAITDGLLNLTDEPPVMDIADIREELDRILEEIRKIWIAIRKKADWTSKYPCPELTAVDGTFTWSFAHDRPLVNPDSGAPIYAKIEIRRESDGMVMLTAAALKDDGNATINFDAFVLGEITTIAAGDYAAYII